MQASMDFKVSLFIILKTGRFIFRTNSRAGVMNSGHYENMKRPTKIHRSIIILFWTSLWLILYPVSRSQRDFLNSFGEQYQVGKELDFIGILM